MRFHAEHRLPGSPEDAIRLLTDPAFHRDLDLPDLSRPEVVEHGTDGDELVLRLRYEFVGHLDPLALRLLGDRKLTWVQELRADPMAHRGRLTMTAEAAPDRLHGRADAVFAPQDGGTVRRLDGELVVAVPAVGRMAERRIVPGVLSRLDIEAAAAAERLG